MIGTSIPEYLFIRACILFIHYIVPLSTLYSIVIFTLGPKKYGVHPFLEIWSVAELLFFLLIYYPRELWLQKAASHPEVVPRDKRRELFQRCTETAEDLERYLSLWHRGAPVTEIKRENLKEFFAWAFLNKGNCDPDDDEELEEYVARTELVLGRKLELGRGSASSLRVTLDAVKTVYRPLFWYLCVFVVDSITYFSLLLNGFQFHRLAIKRFFSIFPLRPFTLFSQHRSPAQTLTYWHRPHISKDRLPLLFIHGIGIGLYPYVNFLNQINEPRKHHKDCSIGIIAIEIMPVSFRITGAALEKDEMCNEILHIVQRHGWDKFILASHSYGSVVCSHLMQSPKTSKLVGPVVLIDPVSILLHLPDVAYNFTCRPPKRANERQLWFFASTDQGVAHTLGRCFFWSENVLWKEDLQGRQVTVSLAGKDLIVDTETVGRYLAGKQTEKPSTEEWKHRAWKGHGLEILWFNELDHAQVFDSKRDCERLVTVIRDYSIKEKPCPKSHLN